MMKKSSFISILILSLSLSTLLSGCQQSTSPPVSSDPNTTKVETATSTPEDASSEKANGLPSLVSELTTQERSLGVDTLEERKAAINSLGEENYWCGIFTAVNYIQGQTNDMSPLQSTLEDAYPNYIAEKVELTSDYDGHTIPADYVLANGTKDNDTIIFIHGAQENRRNFTELTTLYLERGYNIISYDQRSSGESIPSQDLDFYLSCADKVTDYLFNGLTFDNCEMPQYIAKTTVPTLVITSDADTVVDKSMPISLYDAIPGKKALYVSKTAYHCWIHNMEPDAYADLINKFFSGEIFNEN